MILTLAPYFKSFGIDLLGVLPLNACIVRKPYLLTRENFDVSQAEKVFVQIFAVPYLSPETDSHTRNLSAYAVSRDYHLFFAQLYDQLLNRLKADFPEHKFAAFVDHSPIDEIQAAVDAGLGVRGKNHLLLTNRYSSYVFLGEIITTLPLTPTFSSLPLELRICHHCDACVKACPMTTEGGECRSALTQKKGTLSAQETEQLSRFGSVWGCDICQEVCPYTTSARRRGTIYTQIPFFRDQTIPHLTRSLLDEMSDEDFAARAFAWRGREVIRRNLLLKETTTPKEESASC